MTNNQDARPFIDLRKDSEEFQTKFNEDIRECLNFLDAKITTLICDPDSVGNPTKSVKQNTLTEFSKAKYDIFISIKSLINTKEREWLNYISEMKKLFIENVEIFLAGTKLEVKLPSSEFQSSSGSRKTPGNRKSVTSSFLSTLTKNIPVLSSPLQRQEIRSNVPAETSHVGDKVQFNRRGRQSASSTKLSISPSIMIRNQNESTDSSDSSENEAIAGKDEISNVNMDVDESEIDLNTSKSGSRSSTGSRISSLSDLNASQSGSRRRSSLKKETSVINFLEVPEKNMSVIENCGTGAVPESDDVSLTKNFEKYTSRQISKSRKTVAHQKNSSSSDENEEVKNSKTCGTEVPIKGRRGKQAPKIKTNDSTVSSPEEQNIDNINTINEEHIVAEEPVNKVRRGRSGASKTVKNIAVSPPDEQNIEDINTINEEPTQVPVNKVRRGRSGASKDVKNVAEKNVTTRTSARGRRAAKTVTEEIPEPIPSPKKSNLIKNIESSESGISKSPKKVTFTTGENISDDMEMYTPLARSSKSSARRKTLLPNLVDVSGSDVIPGNPSHAKSKRKTISNVSELEVIAPAKRLKVRSQKTISSQDEDDNANDNLLGSDDCYSDWMALKSIDGKIPTCPAVYEVKVWRAKKPAYIGSCESLRQKLTLYKLKQNSGHKHLDKFVDRNYDDIQVRYEVVSSADEAKEKVKSRIKNFVAQHKTTPAYN